MVNSPVPQDGETMKKCENIVLRAHYTCSQTRRLEPVTALLVGFFKIFVCYQNTN